MCLSGIRRSAWELVDGHQALSECEQTKTCFSVERSCARTPGDTHLGSAGFSTADQGVTYFPVLSRPGNKSFSGFNIPSSHHPLRLVPSHPTPPEPHPVLSLRDYYSYSSTFAVCCHGRWRNFILYGVRVSLSVVTTGIKPSWDKQRRLMTES